MDALHCLFCENAEARAVHAEDRATHAELDTKRFQRLTEKATEIADRAIEVARIWKEQLERAVTELAELKGALAAREARLAERVATTVCEHHLEHSLCGACASEAILGAL